MSSLILQQVRSRFAYLQPGQVFTVGDYAGKPKSSTWFFIEDLDRIRTFLKNRGVKMTPRFRGPRHIGHTHVESVNQTYFRGYSAAYGTCLKQDAKFFSIRIDQ